MSDIEQEVELLRDDARQYLEGGDLIAEFDQVAQYFSKPEGLNPEARLMGDA